MKLFELYAELGLDSSGFDRGVNKASKAGGNLASSLKSGIGGASNYIGQQISATTVMLGNLMTDVARKGVDMVKQTATAGIQYNSSMETYVTNFTTMLGGSSEAAKQLTADLEDMAASTPFAMSDLAGATNTLLAFGQESETVLETLQSLGDISMGDANKLQSLTLAFSQASSSGKLMGQDLMQMINAGFNPLQTIVDKTGASMGDLKEFMSSGKASADLKKQMREAKREVKALGDNASEGAKMLVQMSKDGAISADLLGQIFELETSPGGRFYNAMKNASQTFEGLVSTLEDDSNALLGKVFKPLSDWMTTDLLPNAIGAIGQISAAFDEGELEGAVSKAVEVAGGYFDQLGQKALDTGSGLMANVLSGLTGDMVSGQEVSNLISDVWDDGTTAAQGFIDTGKGVLKGIWDGLTGDSDNKTNITAELSGLWTDATTTLGEFADAAGGVLGAIYTKLTGQEATAANIGKTIGGAFKAGSDAIDTILTGATSLMSDVAGAISGDQESIDRIKKTFTDTFDELPAAMNKAVSESGGFLSRLYENITGDTKGASKLQALFDEAGETVEQGAKSARERAGELAQTAKEGATAWGEVFSYLGKEYVGPAVTDAVEDAVPILTKFGEWVSKNVPQDRLTAPFTSTGELEVPDVSVGEAVGGWSSLGGFLRDWLVPQEKTTPTAGYQTDWATGYQSRWEPGQYSQRRPGSPFNQDQEPFDGESLTSAIAALTAAAASLAGDAAAAAAAAIAGAKIEMDGAAVGRIVTPYVSQGVARGGRVRQKAQP